MAVCDSPPVLLDRPLQQRRKEKETGTPAGHEEPGGGAPRLGELFLHGDDPAGVDGGEGDWQEEPVSSEVRGSPPSPLTYATRRAPPRMPTTVAPSYAYESTYD